MTDFDNDDEISEDILKETAKGSSSKKIIMIAIIALIVIIGVIVAASVSFEKEDKTSTDKYSVVELKSQDKNNPENSIVVLYDLPEITVKIGDRNSDVSNLKMKINIEISKTSDIKRIEALMPRILDAVISLTAEMSKEDIHGAKELYFLKEELIYRISLIVDPIKIHNLNFRSIETVK